MTPTPQQAANEDKMKTQREWLKANGIEYDTDGNGRITRAYSVKGKKSPMVTTNIETGGIMIREDAIWFMIAGLVVAPPLLGWLIHSITY